MTKPPVVQGSVEEEPGSILKTRRSLGSWLRKTKTA